MQKQRIDAYDLEAEREGDALRSAPGVIGPRGKKLGKSMSMNNAVPPARRTSRGNCVSNAVAKRIYETWRNNLKGA